MGIGGKAMRKIELELAELRTRLERLERWVRQLAGEKEEVPPPMPGVPPDPQQLIAWLRAQGLIREPTPEEPVSYTHLTLPTNREV